MNIKKTEEKNLPDYLILPIQIETNPVAISTGIDPKYCNKIIDTSYYMPFNVVSEIEA